MLFFNSPQVLLEAVQDCYAADEVAALRWQLTAPFDGSLACTHAFWQESGTQLVWQRQNNRLNPVSSARSGSQFAPCQQQPPEFIIDF